MKYAIALSSVGPWGSPRPLSELGALAERSGWDGVFLEDYILYADGLDTFDPWVALAAIAMATERVRIGTLITPLPRRRPWKVAAEAMSVDHLSQGRMVLGVGSGDPMAADMTRVGEERDARVRGAMLDESLEVIDGLWSGDLVDHHGDHYTLDGVALRPRPVQRPRIPIWVGGQYTRRRPRERALRWDGACLYRAQPPAWEDMAPGDVHELRRLAGQRSDGGAGFAIVIGGRRRADDLSAERRYIDSIAEAGADWWIEWVPPQTPVERVHELIEPGPLRAG